MSPIQRLITDQDVLLGRVNSPIVLDDVTLLTPAARDRAMVKGLRIVERGEQALVASCGSAPEATRGTSPDANFAAASAACGRCGQATCTRCAKQSGHCGAAEGRHDMGRPQAAPSGADGLADGLYLVRIEGGRRVSVQPAAGQGLMRRAGEATS